MITDNKSNNRQQSTSTPAKKRSEDPGLVYIITAALSIVLAIFLGVLTNRIIDYIGRKLRLSFYAVLIIQIFFVAFVVYLMKKISPYIHHEPLENYNYDVIFVSIYMGSQANFQKLIQSLISE